LARETAERGAQNVPDRPWAAHIGRPTMLRAWRTQDILGLQTYLGVLFAYQGREHALMVLIDHELGGGVKDCWLTAGRDAANMRNAIAAAMATDPHSEFEDIDVVAVAQLLREALGKPPCPVDEEQVDDVARHLYLARARAELLAELAGLPLSEPSPVTETPDATTRAVLRIKVSLRGLKPPVWRRLEVPAEVSLAQLHRVLQTAFGWTDSHLHAFDVDDARGRRSLEGAVLRRTRLQDVIHAVGDRLVYRYDFGDGWEHVIQLEEREALDPTARYPRCTGGRRAAPPEDSGGVPGYQALLEALADPDHPDHDELAAWAPPRFDPAAFDRAAVDVALGSLR
jgi:hypothetical protein